MTISRAKGAKAKADKYASLITRSKGACESCGSTQNLQTMHIISRRYAHTRTNLTNLLCGCAKCHRYFTDYPIAFRDFVIGKIGQLEYDNLHGLSMLRTKVNWDEQAAGLKLLWERIEAAA